ncbi:hypothetical protein Chor_005604 [Crotalus horridus]
MYVERLPSDGSRADKTWVSTASPSCGLSPSSPTASSWNTKLNITRRSTRTTVLGLKPATRYIFQVRARTSAGCGKFSQALEVETAKAIVPPIRHHDGGVGLPDTHQRLGSPASAPHLQEEVGSSPLSRLDSSRLKFPESKFYLESHTYEDPCQAAHEVMREIDASRIKIEESYRLGQTHDDCDRVHGEWIPGFLPPRREDPRSVDGPRSLHLPEFSSASDVWSYGIVTFTQTLSERGHIDFTRCGSVGEWLDSIRLGRYQENFALAGYSSLGMVMHMNIEDVQNLGINLTGHQRKILTSIQIMRSQLLNTMGCRRPL